MIDLKRLGQVRPTDTNNVTLYTVPASTGTRIEEIIACNTTVTEATFRVFLVPSGGTADETTAIAFDYSVPANQLIVLSIQQVLATGGTIVVRTGTASALTFTASGGEIT